MRMLSILPLCWLLACRILAADAVPPPPAQSANPFNPQPSPAAPAAGGSQTSWAQPTHAQSGQPAGQMGGQKSAAPGSSAWPNALVPTATVPSGPSAPTTAQTAAPVVPSSPLPSPPPPIDPTSLTPAGVEVWLDRTTRLPRLAANLIREVPQARPISQDYRLIPGDLIRLVTWGGLQMNQQVPVDPAGTLALPGVGAVPVSGLTVAEAQARLGELLRTQVRNAGLIVAVDSATGAGVTVTGEVNTPGSLTVPPGGTVLEALAAAGGVREGGTLRAIQVRTGGGAAAPVDLYRIALDGDSSALVPLPPGAQIHVPLAAGAQVQVFGAVRRPGDIELAPEAPLAQALAFAGGLAPGADPANLRLLREGPDGQIMVQVSAVELERIVAKDGDRLLVDERRAVGAGSGSIAVDGLVRDPGTHAWRDGLSVQEALAGAGGVLPGGDVSELVIERTLAEPRTIDLGGGIMGRIFKELVADVGPATVLRPLDRLVVPQAPQLAQQRATITVQGAVRTPGVFPFNPELTVRDALKLAGGLLPEAQTDQADIVRVRIAASGQRDVDRLAVELRPVLDGAPGQTLMNLDTIVIRTRSDDRVRIAITGEVANTGSFVLPRGTTLRQALKIAGGLTEDSFPQGTRFYRVSEAKEAQRQLDEMVRQLSQAVAVNQQQLATANTPTGQKILQATVLQQESELARMQRATATGRMAGIDLQRISAGEESADFVLQNGDAIEIPSRPGTIRVLGEVMVPGSLRVEPGLRATDAIRRSGGTTAQADLDRVFVVRADGSVVASAAFTGTAWSSSERRWVRTDLRKLELLEGDSVIVPPDLEYHRDGMELAKDWSQILFQVAAAAGTIALLSR